MSACAGSAVISIRFVVAQKNRCIDRRCESSRKERDDVAQLWGNARAGGPHNVSLFFWDGFSSSADGISQTFQCILPEFLLCFKI